MAFHRMEWRPMTVPFLCRNRFCFYPCHNRYHDMPLFHRLCYTALLATLLLLQCLDHNLIVCLKDCMDRYICTSLESILLLVLGVFKSICEYRRLRQLMKFQKQLQLMVVFPKVLINDNSILISYDFWPCVWTT